MTKILIYCGPKESFELVLPKRTTKITLTELAIKSDSKMREHLFRIEGQEQKPIENEVEEISCLVAYSDEYAGLSENAIQSFVSFISRFNIKSIYLQNPPVYIVEQLNKIKKNIKTIKYEYKTIDYEVIKKINQDFSSNIIGQEEVKKYLLTALYPLCKENFVKPIVLMFYGPTGVGKTETAKFLSGILDEKLFRKQFSMFHSDDFSAYLFGGKHSQNCLAKELLERESNIILFDEFDKPHPVFHSAFYQLFDEGVFEDKNYNVEVKKAIVICTSNYNSEDEVRKKLGDPIFSRFDAVIRFAPLSTEAIIKIIKNEFGKQISDLTKDERTLVEQNKVVEKIIGLACRLINARQIKRIIREAISAVLIEDILCNKEKV